MSCLRNVLRLSITSICFIPVGYSQPRIASAVQPLDGAIAGKVVDESGSPVKGAEVTLQHFQPVQGRGQKITSKPDGTFIIPQLPSGDYASCVTVPKSDYVDDCTWNLTFLPRIQPAIAATATGGKASPPMLITDVPHGSSKITVSALTTTAPQQLNVRKGARIVIQFLDPAKKIDKQSHLVVGALGPRGLMILAEETPGPNLTFELVIPFDTDVKVMISSLDLLATGPTGTVNFASGYMLPFKVARTAKTPITTTFTVTGKKGK